MAGWIAVLVDNKELVRFTRLRDGDSGVLNLTTMLPQQEQALVEVFFVRGSLRQQITTFHIHRIRRGEPRPQIVVSAHVRGDATITLRIDGERIATESFPIPEEFRRARTALWMGSVAAVLVLAALGLGIWWLAGSGSGLWADAFSQRPARVTPSTPATDSPPASSRGQGPDSSEPPADTAQSGTRNDTEQEPADQVGDAATDRNETERLADPSTPAAVPETETSTDTEESPTAQAEERERPTVQQIGLELTLYFEPESAELIPATREELEATTQAIVTWVREGGSPDSLVVTLTGHTALFGTEESRVELSGRRAAAAADYLSERMRDEGVSNVEIEEVARGGRQPVTREEDSQWRNRRVEVTVGLE